MDTYVMVVLTVCLTHEVTGVNRWASVGLASNFMIRTCLYVVLEYHSYLYICIR
jgi:hypothetical protein